MRKAILAICMLVIIGPTIAGQEELTANQSVADLLTRLHSKDWVERAQAYEQLASDSAALQEQEVKVAMIDLLDRENHITPAAGTMAQDGEAYGEYVSSLIGSVMSIVNWQDPRQLCILAHSPFDPDSKLATRLVLTGQLVLPCLMQMAESKSFGDRYIASELLVHIGGRSSDLSIGTAQKIRAVTIASLHDPDEMVRVGTVHALTKFGREDMISALEEIAETDPAPEVQGYSIRKMATEAIAAIQTRSHK
jgi:HEAT repeat protein